MVASWAEGTDGGLDSRKGTRRSRVGRRKRKVRTKKVLMRFFLPDGRYPVRMQQPNSSGAKTSAMIDI
jgi:hypothetical protein